MRTQFLDAKSIISSRERSLKRELENIQHENRINPKLGVLLVTGDQVAMAQVEKFIRFSHNIGFEVEVEQIAERNVDRSFAAKLNAMSSDESFMGIWVSTPRFDFPPYDVITLNLPPDKDLSACHHILLGRYMYGKPGLVPPKVRAVHDMLEEYVEGYLEKGIVVISTKNDGTRGFFGKYLMGYFYDLGARTSIRNVQSSSREPEQIIEMYNPLGEVVITALNTSNAVNGEKLKKGSYVIDTGYNFQRTRLSGDVDVNTIRDTVSAITPVPGGIDALIPIEILVNAMDLVRAKVGVPRMSDRRRGIRRSDR